MADATDFQTLISDTESKYGLPPNMLQQILKTESGFNPQAVNKASGATGIAQVLPSTAHDPGYGIRAFDPTDPVASIDFAGHYLSALRKTTGSWEDALRHYGTLAGNVGMSYSAAPQNEAQRQLLSLAMVRDAKEKEQQQAPSPAPATLDARSQPDATDLSPIPRLGSFGSLARPVAAPAPAPAPADPWAMALANLFSMLRVR